MTISKKLFLIFMCFPILAQANVLLLPDAQVTFADYQSKCKKDGYECVYNYFQAQIINQPTPLFEKFISSIDLSANEFKLSALTELNNLLKMEMIDMEQLDLILTFIQQLREENKTSNKVSLLEKSLIQVKDILSKSKPLEESDYEDYVIYMKKPILKSELKKISKAFLQLPYYEINFRKVPLFKKDRLTYTAENLVDGQCEKTKIHETIQTKHWQIHQEKSCSFNEQIQKVTSVATTKISENKNWLITGAVLIGVAVLMSKYEVKFQF